MRAAQKRLASVSGVRFSTTAGAGRMGIERRLPALARLASRGGDDNRARPSALFNAAPMTVVATASLQPTRAGAPRSLRQKPVRTKARACTAPARTALV